MKKNKLMRLASGLMVAVLLTTCVISGTFAKYTSTATAGNTVTVAKWDVEVNGTAVQDVADFNLFSTTANYDEADNDVADGKIAPGTKGSFAFEVENKSEVTAKYDITFTVTNADNLPIKFYSDAACTTEITPDGDGVYAAGSNADGLAIGAASETKTVYWQWAFERGADAADTQFGIDATASVTVTATITATQVD